ncbi:MAG: hypothetical protein IKG14_05610 [Clostridia bacterium]|nr:hypothetical protein [Clostridia bacterium]
MTIKRRVIMIIVTTFLVFSIFKYKVFATEELTVNVNSVDSENNTGIDISENNANTNNIVVINESLDNNSSNNADENNTNTNNNVNSSIPENDNNANNEGSSNNTINSENENNENLLNNSINKVGSNNESINEEDLNTNNDESQNSTNYGWIEQNNNMYYYDIDGQMVYGVAEIDGDTYYFDNETGALVKGAFINIDGKLYYFGLLHGELQKNGWTSVSGKQYYLDTITGEVAIGLKEIDGKSYFFNENGIMQKGKFINIGGKLYYFGAQSGTLQKTGWYEKNGKKYYLDEQTGEVYTGTRVIDGKTYVFDSDGKLKDTPITGLVTINGKTYYYENGTMVKGKFINIEGKLYYFGAQSGTLQKTGWYKDKYYLDPTTGEVAVGLKEISNKKYYFSDTGVIRKGRAIAIGNDLYYFDETTGEMVKGKFVTIDSKIYYFGANSGKAQKVGWYTKSGYKYYLDTTTGEAYTGNRTIEGEIYSFDSKGRLKGTVSPKGLLKVDGKTYYFDDDGNIVKGQMVTNNGNSYYFNATTGVMVKGAFVSIDDNYYYFGASSGKLQKTGWYENYGAKYYFDKQTGEVYIGERIIDGVTYYFDQNGKLQSDYKKMGIKEISGKTYFLDENNNIVKGKFIRIDGKIYYFGASSGALQKSGWYIKNGDIYYLDKENGEVYTGQVFMDGKYFYFNGDGKLIGANISYEQEQNTLVVSGKTHYIGNLNIGQFVTKSGKIYYEKPFTSGYVKEGWISIFFDTYYSNKTTGEIYTGFHKISGETYYFNDKGILQKGLREIDGKYYYFDLNTGVMSKGDFCSFNLKRDLYGINNDEDDKLYYLGAQSGALQKTGWYTKNGKDYYIDKITGEVYTGIQNIQGIMYLFDSNGILCGIYGNSENLITEENETYYVNNIGEYVKGEFVYIEDTREKNVYYFDKTSGKLKKSGWFTKNNYKYYSDIDTGRIYRGKCKIGEKYYYFDNLKGILQKDVILTQFVTDSNGEIVPVANYFDKTTGEAKVGWIESNKYEKIFYADENAELYRGILTLDNDKYLFDSQYALVKGWYCTDNNRIEYYISPSPYDYGYDFYYGDLETGKLYIGLYQMGECLRFFDDNGVLQVNKDLSINGVNYHADYYGILSIIE